MLRDMRLDGMSKEEIKEELILAGLRELVEDGPRMIMPTIVDGKIYGVLQEEDTFDDVNYVGDTVPENWEIKRYLSNNSDIGFATILDSDGPGTWILEPSDYDTDQYACPNCDGIMLEPYGHDVKQCSACGTRSDDSTSDQTADDEVGTDGDRS